MQRFGLGFGLLLLILASGNSAFAFGRAQDKRPDAAPAILASFRSSCGSLGRWTTQANAETGSIIQIIESLKTTDACKGFAPELNAIQSAAVQLQNLQMTATYSTYRTDQENLQLLTTTLQTTPATSPGYADIQTALNNLQVQMAHDEAAYDVENKTSVSNLVASQASSLASYAQTLVAGNSSSSLVSCLNQSPVAAMELGTNLMSYGGSFLTPVYGASVSLISQLINTGMELFRESSYDDAIFQSQTDQMPDALNCALEAMSDFYCNADDSYRLLELARANRDKDYRVSALWRGIDILGRQLPGLVTWLNQIRNGVPPSDAYQAGKEITAINNVFTVEQTNLQLEGTINDAVNSYNGDNSASKNQWLINVIVSSAESLAPVAPQGDSSHGPFFNFQANPFVWECWLALGYQPPANCPPVAPTDFNPGLPPTTVGLTNYVKNTLASDGAGFPAMAPKLMSNWASVEGQVENFVNSYFARTITTNAESIIASAFTPSVGTINPISPHDVLKNISDYLQSMMDYNYPNNPRLPALLRSKKEKIDQALKQLEDSDEGICGPLTPEECNTKRMMKVFGLFDLRDGTQVVTTDIQDIVSTDIQDRFASGEITGPQNDVLETAGEALFLRLEEAGLGNLQPASDDLNFAQADIETDLRVFREFFAGAFDTAVQHEGVLSAGEALEGPHRPHGEKLGQLCMMWLITGNIPGATSSLSTAFPTQASRDLCLAATIYNGNNNPDTQGHYAPAFVLSELDRRLGPLPFSKRVCEYHNYKLKNQAETLIPRYLRR